MYRTRVTRPPLRDWRERNVLFLSCLPLTRKLAAKAWRRGGLVRRVGSFADLLGEAYLVLMRAAELYDPARGVKFCSYAGECVKLALHRLARTEGIIRLPDWGRYRDKGYPETYEAALRALRVRRLVVRAAGGELPLDLPQPGTEEGPSYPHLYEALSRLPRKLRRVLEWRFGLCGREPRSLTALAARLRVSKQRASQLYGQALAELRGLLQEGEVAGA